MAPGAQVTAFGALGATSQVNLRGASAAQTPVYFGAIRVNDEVAGVGELGDFPPFLLEAVEVYRSHAPLGASDWGLGGLILLVPREAHRTESELSATVGSWGTRSVGASVASVSDGRQLMAGFSLGAADNGYPVRSSNGTLYEAADDRRAALPNADYAQDSYWMRARQQLGPWTLELFAQRGERELGVPKLALTPSRTARARVERTLAAVTSRVALPSLQGALEATTAVVQASTTLSDPAQELGLFRTWIQTPGEHVQQELTLRHALASGWTLHEKASCALDGLRRVEQQGAAFDEEALAARRVQGRLALALEGRPLPQLELYGQGAVVGVGTRAYPGGESQSTALSGQVGAMTQRGGGSLSLTTGHYYRLPTLSELYGQGLLLRGSADLRQERGDSVELVARYQRGSRRSGVHLWTEVSPFARFSRDLVVFVRTAQGYLVPQNRDRARVVGAEWSAGTAWSSGWSATSSVSLLDPRDTSPHRQISNDVLPFASRAVLTATVTYERRVGRWVFRPGAQAQYQSSRFADRAGLAVVPQQASVDVLFDALLTFADAQPALTWRQRLTNLLDSPRFDVVGFPLPGRSYYSSLEIQW